MYKLELLRHKIVFKILPIKTTKYKLGRNERISNQDEVKWMKNIL